MHNPVSRIPPVEPATREQIAAGPRGRAAHDALLARLPFAGCVEVKPPSQSGASRDRLRIVAWNLERGARPAAAAALLRRVGADLALLSELDVGMARTGQRHAARDIAAALGAGYAFGVEFLELGLGGTEERRRHAGATNDVGYHGNAILSTCPLEAPQRLALEARGDWFGTERDEPRVGGRIAVLAGLLLGDRVVQVASAHLESHGDPEQRASELGVLLAAIEARAPGGPALIGGDLNTTSLERADLIDPERLRRALGEDPGRLTAPFAHEPLFAVAERAGYEWRSCNVLGTGSHRVAATNQRSALRLDWFLSRGLVCEDPEVIEAVDPEDGSPLSDHEALAITVEPA